MRGEAVSRTVPPGVNLKTIEIVVVGDVGATVLHELGGFHVASTAAGRTHLVGQVDDPFRLYDLLTALGNAEVPLVSLNAMEGAPGD
jgi:hypothetical protein